MKIEHIALYVNDLNAARDFFIRYLEQMGYAHIAFSLGSKEKVDALTKRLKTDGYEIVSGPRTTAMGVRPCHQISMPLRKVKRMLPSV